VLCGDEPEFRMVERRRKSEIGGQPEHHGGEQRVHRKGPLATPTMAFVAASPITQACRNQRMPSTDIRNRSAVNSLVGLHRRRGGFAMPKAPADTRRRILESGYTLLYRK